MPKVPAGLESKTWISTGNFLCAKIRFTEGMEFQIGETDDDWWVFNENENQWIRLTDSQINKLWDNAKKKKKKKSIDVKIVPKTEQQKPKRILPRASIGSKIQVGSLVSDQNGFVGIAFGGGSSLQVITPKGKIENFSWYSSIPYMMKIDGIDKKSDKHFNEIAQWLKVTFPDGTVSSWTGDYWKGFSKPKDNGKKGKALLNELPLGNIDRETAERIDPKFAACLKPGDTELDYDKIREGGFLPSRSKFNRGMKVLTFAPNTRGSNKYNFTIAQVSSISMNNLRSRLMGEPRITLNNAYWRWDYDGNVSFGA